MNLNVNANEDNYQYIDFNLEEDGGYGGLSDRREDSPHLGDVEIDQGGFS
jgi:hypothetical protein